MKSLRKREIAIAFHALTCSIVAITVCTVLGSLAGAGAVRADVPPPTDLGGRIDPATFDIPAIQKAYRKILARWASGGRGEAVNDLKALELGVVGVDGKGRERLWKAELQAVHELEEAQHESLLPVMVLHQESYAAYRDLHNPYLSLHARDFTQSLAEVYATREPDGGLEDLRRPGADEPRELHPGGLADRARGAALRALPGARPDQRGGPLGARRALREERPLPVGGQIPLPPRQGPPRHRPRASSGSRSRSSATPRSSTAGRQGAATPPRSSVSSAS